MKFKIYYQRNDQLKHTTLESNCLNSLYLQNELPSNIVKIISKNNYSISFNLSNYKHKDLIEFYAELSTILLSKLSLKIALDILYDAQSNAKIKEIIYDLKQALNNGQSLHIALEKHVKIVGDISILFFRLGEQNSNMDVSVKYLHKILKQNDEIKKSLLSSITYPSILLVSLLLSIITIIYFVVPKFEYIFNQLGDNLPFSTKLLLDIKFMMDNYYIVLLSSIIIFYMLIKLVYYKFKYNIDKILILYIPIVSAVYKSIVFYKLFLTLWLITKSKFQFQEAMINTKNISNNKYIIMQLENIINDINNGISISESFSKTKLFDALTIRLLLTAQRTNNLEMILKDIGKIYKNRLKQSIRNFTTFFEPFLVLFISIIILWLVLAIMTPIWELGSLIN